MDQVAAGARRRHTLLKAAFWSTLALAILIAAFDWNWFRPQVERYFSEKSHRSVRIAEFHVSWSARLDPTFHLRGVQIENAPWADARPFIVAAELDATCPLSSLIEKRPIIRHLRLVDADIDLERQADGLRNWRLTRPDDRGPGIIHVESLEAVRSRIRFVHRGLDLDVQTAAAPADAAAAPLTTRITFEGTFRGAPFSGAADAGPELTFLDTGRPVPIRGHVLAAGGARLDVDGRAADLFRLGTIDAAVALKAPSLALFGPFLDRTLPRTPALAISGRLKKAAEATTLEDASLAIGSSQVSGTVSLDRTEQASQWRADLHGRALRLEDLRWTAGFAKALMQPAEAEAPQLQQPTRASPGPMEAVAAAVPPPDRGAASRSRLQADVHVKLDRLSAASWPAASDVELTARLADGVLAVAPLGFAIGGGRATARLDVDTNRTPTEGRLRADLRGVRLEAMLPSLPADKRITGALEGAVEIGAHGRSIEQWLATLAGTVSARLHAGSMARKLDAELGLSGSRFLRALFGGGEQVPIRCAAADIELRAGHARTRSLLVETDGTHINGSGSADLRSGAFDMLLTPSPERPGLLELRKAIQLRRVGGKLSYALAEPKLAARPRSCLERSP